MFHKNCLLVQSFYSRLLECFRVFQDVYFVCRVHRKDSVALWSTVPCMTIATGDFPENLLLSFLIPYPRILSGNMESGKRGQVARKEHAKGNAQPDIIKTFEAGYT